jgi:hypothetical protein
MFERAGPPRSQAGCFLRISPLETRTSCRPATKRLISSLVFYIAFSACLSMSRDVQGKYFGLFMFGCSIEAEVTRLLA